MPEYADIIDNGFIKKARSLVTVDINRNTTFDKQVEIISAERKKYQLCNLHDFSYGTMITVDSLKNGRFEDYSKLFVEIPSPTKSDELHIQPAGNYVRAFYRDAAESPELCYQRIFDYVKEHGLVLSGFSYDNKRSLLKISNDLLLLKL